MRFLILALFLISLFAISNCNHEQHKTDKQDLSTRPSATTTVQAKTTEEKDVDSKPKEVIHTSRKGPKHHSRKLSSKDLISANPNENGEKKEQKTDYKAPDSKIKNRQQFSVRLPSLASTDEAKKDNLSPRTNKINPKTKIHPKEENRKGYIKRDHVRPHVRNELNEKMHHGGHRSKSFSIIPSQHNPVLPSGFGYNRRIMNRPSFGNNINPHVPYNRLSNQFLIHDFGNPYLPFMGNMFGLPNVYGNIYGSGMGLGAPFKFSYPSENTYDNNYDNDDNEDEYGSSSLIFITENQDNHEDDENDYSDSNMDFNDDDDAEYSKSTNDSEMKDKSQGSHMTEKKKSLINEHHYEYDGHENSY